jgi:TP901 family phage tail tape measure protein
MEAGAVLVRIMADSSALTAGLNRASGRMAAFGQKMSKVGMGMTKYLTLPLLAVGAVSIKMASDFEGSMRLIQTQAGGSAKDVEVLSKAVLQLAAKGQHGPKALADSLYHLKSVGMDNAQAMAALTASEHLASVGHADLEATTNAVAGAFKSGISGAQSFSKAVGTINAIIGAGNLRMDDFNAAMGTGVAVTARQFGVSLTSLGASLAMITSRGIPATRAAMSLRMAMQMMGAPTAAAAKVMGNLGLSTTDLAKAMRAGGLVQAIGMLKDHLAGLSKVDATAALSKMFGSRSSGAILTLIGNLKDFQRTQDQIVANSKSFWGMVGAQAEDASAKWAHFKSALGSVAVTLGNVLLPIAKKMADDFGKLATAFGNLSPGTQSFIVKLGLVVAAAGPLAFIVGKLVSVFVVFGSAAITAGTAVVATLGNIVFAMQAVAGGAATMGEGLALALGPAGIVGAIVVGTAAAIVGVVALEGAIGKLASTAESVRKVQEMTQPGQTPTGRVGGGGGASYDTAAAAGRAARQAFDKAMQPYKPTIISIEAKMQVLGYDAWRRAYAEVQAFKTLADKGINMAVAFTKKGADLSAYLRDISTQTGISIPRITKMFKDMGGNISTILGDKLPADIRKNKAKMDSALVASVVKPMGGIVSSVRQSAVKAAAGLVAGLRQGNGPTKAAASGLAKNAAPKLPSFVPVGLKVPTGLASGMNSGKGKVSGAAQGLAAAATPKAPNTFGLGASIGAGLAAGMYSKVRDVAAAAGALSNGAIVVIHHALKNPPTPSVVTYKLGMSFAQGFAKGISKGTAEAVSAASQLASDVSSILASALDIGASVTTLGTQGMPTLKVAKGWAKKVAALVHSMTDAMQSELKKLNLGKKNANVDRFSAASSMAGDMASIFAAFTELTPESIAKAMAGIAYAKTQAKTIAVAVASMVEDFRTALTTAITEGQATNVSNAAGIAGNVADILGSFADMTVDGITKAVTGMNEAAHRAPELAAAMVSMVGSLQTALAGVTTGDEFTGLVDSITQIVSDITGAISSLGSMTEKAIQDGIWGAGWVAKKAMELGDALRRMVGWLNLALQGIDTAALAGMQEKLSVLSDIAGKTAAIVGDLAGMTPAQLSAAGAAGSGAGLFSALAGASGGNTYITQSYSVSVPVNASVTSVAQAQQVGTTIANTVIALATAHRSTNRGSA